jgi:hypothetical protein
MKQTFRHKRFSRSIRVLIDQSVEIVEEYQAQNIKLTLRQLYYQLVSRGFIANTQKEYSKVSRVLTDARYSGLVDWSMIEDRVRLPKLPNHFENLNDLIDAAVRSYKLDRWKGQEYTVELFCEKDALASVLYPIANEWHVTFAVNRGYASATAMYDTALRLANSGRKPVILYLGDHDPSGLDMIRDVETRINEFGVNVKVIPIAITIEQIRKYDPPPNPAKITDTRATEYINRYGRYSWEVDALPPDILQTLVKEKIRNYVDIGLMDKIKGKESRDKTKLLKLVSKK